MSEPTTIVVLIAETIRGHKLRGMCEPSAKRGRTCTTTVKRRTLTFSRSAGSSTFELRTAGLGRGKYTATIIAENANGKSSPVRLTFTITDK